ncbi:MAG: hypothetical protein AAF226_16740, partial [Verrucomicrobiota bacterium]
MSIGSAHTEEEASLMILPPPHQQDGSPSPWVIEVYADGQMRATYASTLADQMWRPKGSVDFENLIAKTKTLVAREPAASATRILILTLEMKDKALPAKFSYLADDTFIRSILLSDSSIWYRPPEWHSILGSNHASDREPISEEMRQLLIKNPFYPKIPGHLSLGP